MSEEKAAFAAPDSWCPLLPNSLRRADASAESMQGGRRRRAQLLTLRSALGMFESRTGMTMASRALEEDPSDSPA
jgi:hypothetical protein